jgi:hypothetical protein
MKYVLANECETTGAIVASDASMRYAYDYFGVQKRNYNYPAIVVADSDNYG